MAQGAPNNGRGMMLRVLLLPFLAMILAFSCGFFIPFQEKGDEREKLLAAHVAGILRFLSFMVLWIITMLPGLDIPKRERLLRVKGGIIFMATASHLIYFALRWNVFRIAMGIFDVVIFICWVQLMSQVREKVNPPTPSPRGNTEHGTAVRSPYIRDPI